VDEHALSTRLEACEAQVTRLRRALAGAGGGLVLLAGVVAAGFTRPGAPPAAPPSAGVDVDSLRVRELVVVDPSGTVRARVGGDLPDALTPGGRRQPRGDRAAGLMLYDASGRERGGYVTFERSGYVGLTLDSRERQVASFLAGPEGAAPYLEMPRGGLVRLQAGDAAVEVRADSAGGARLNALRAGRVVAQTPGLTAAQRAATCAEMREELLRQAQMRMDEAQRACSARVPAAACRACFGTR
jgi:hypothetical protein